MLKMCPQCQGTKKVKGLGMMKSECPVCEGLGKLDSEKITPGFRPAAIPIKREMLPEDHYRKQQAAKTAGLENANCAYKNYPSNFVPNKDTQNTPGADKPSNAAKELTPNDINELKTKIVERDDNIGMSKIKLSPAIEAELRAMETAKDAEAADTIVSTYVEPVGETVAKTVDPTIVTPLKTEVKRGRQKAAKG